MDGKKVDLPYNCLQKIHNFDLIKPILIQGILSTHNVVYIKNKQKLAVSIILPIVLLTSIGFFYTGSFLSNS